MRHWTSFVALVVLCAAASVRAQTSYPMIQGLKPAAVQIGATSEIEVPALYSLRGATQVIFVGEGVTAEPVDAALKEGQQHPGSDSLKLKVTVAADALPGVRDFRIITPRGASTLGQMVLVRDPVIVEADKNDTLADAQAVTLPATLCGSIEKAEDVDYYKFTVAAGAALSFHVRSCRLEDKLHDFQTRSDPILTLRNAAGVVLEQVDNFFFADPVLSYKFPQAGEYFLEIRDVRYKGLAHWYYSIEANDRPFVTNVYPMALAPGQETRVELVGFQLPADPFSLLTLPADAPEGRRWAGLPLLGGVAGTPVPVVASRLPLIQEAAGENNVPAQSQPFAVPCGVNGRIEQPGDIDCFAFDAKKDERFTLEVVARRHQSALDPILRLTNDQGATLVENDDFNVGRHAYADAMIENWTAPADGKYFVEIRDLHLRGGKDFVYFLKATRSEPYFDLEIDTDKTLLTPGTGGAIYVRVYRKNGFTGEIALAIEGLPPGVTASCGRILADGTDGCIVLQAAADAPRGAANVRITGTGTMAGADGAMTQLATVARPLQEVYNPGGGRTHFPVEIHTVSIGETMDLKGVKITPNRITLKPGESQKIDIVIDRREGFDKNVTLECVYQHLGAQYGNNLPKGVTVDDKASKTLLTAAESQGSIVLKAAADASAVKDHQLAVMANVSINFVMKFSYCAEPLIVTIERPTETAAK